MERDTQRTHTTSPSSFPIVGIGASAGGLEAFTQLLLHLPTTTDMAYVLVQHLAPTHGSLLVNLLARTTRMNVHEAREGMEVEANHIYIIAPDTDLTLEQNSLHVVPQTKTSGQHLSIDTFLMSLAENTQHLAIGVILSGMGSDGTRGLQAIKERGGITLAQDWASAQSAAMPQNALATGCIDFIGSPQSLAQELTRISHHPLVSRANVAEIEAADNEGAEGEQTFRQILRLLNLRTAVDFTLYKPTMLKRRVQRRMVLQQIDRASAYVAYLHDHQAEVLALSQDFLIGVTAFFRHPAADQALTHEIFPRLLETKAPLDPLRIWIPGCSTGEEVYSLAICLQEFLSERNIATPFQCFGTDLNGTAIEQARKGSYASGLLGGVSPQRLERFFLTGNGSARITTSIRACCVFAQHNLLKDPPFSHLDLLMCQNMLIYLGPVAQKKSLQLFHYALSSHGFLLLGPAETIGTDSDLFAHTGQHQRLYQKKAGSGRSWFTGDVRGSGRGEPPDKPEEGNNMRSEEKSHAYDIQKEMDRVLLARYAPASVAIDDEMEILYFRGQTSPYLQPASGKASLNLLKMAHESLGLALRTAISQARKSGQPVKKEGLQMKDQGVLREVQVEVIPLHASATEYSFVILFEETPMKPRLPGVLTRAVIQYTERAARTTRDRRIEYLENEVVTTRQEMRSIIEEREATNEELQSANEEILSSNEELRSLNEELETSKEEIQASNEELRSFNEELKQRSAELAAARVYAEDIVKTIREPLLVLDADLRVQRANPAFYQFFQVESAEIEQHLLFDLDDRQWDIPALRTLLEELLPTTHFFTDYTMEHIFPRIGRKTIVLNAHRIDHVPLILLAMEDVTSRTQAEKERQELLQQRTEFMAIASHELKTPVTSMKVLTQLLLRRFRTANEQDVASLLAKMETQLDKLIALIDELLDVTRIESGQLRWENKLFDLDALVRETVEVMAQTTEHHQIRIVGAIPTPVSGNADRLAQVLTNLLSNAIKYSPQAKVILITLQVEKDVATVGIQDFGVGIPPEKQEQVFERFFRVTDQEHVGFPGLGLGLYISAEIVKRLGGRMWVESQRGAGSTFFFTVPCPRERSSLTNGRDNAQA